MPIRPDYGCAAPPRSPGLETVFSVAHIFLGFALHARAPHSLQAIEGMLCDFMTLDCDLSLAFWA